MGNILLAAAGIFLIWLGIRIARIVIDWAEPSDNSCREFSDSDGRLASILRGNDLGREIVRGEGSVRRGPGVTNTDAIARHKRANRT